MNLCQEVVIVELEAPVEGGLNGGMGCRECKNQTGREMACPAGKMEGKWKNRWGVEKRWWCKEVPVPQHVTPSELDHHSKGSKIMKEIDTLERVEHTTDAERVVRGVESEKQKKKGGENRSEVHSTQHS